MAITWILDHYEAHRSAGASREVAKNLTLRCYDDLDDWAYVRGRFE